VEVMVVEVVEVVVEAEVVAVNNFLFFIISRCYG
jgi:hypothetical protein